MKSMEDSVPIIFLHGAVDFDLVDFEQRPRRCKFISFWAIKDQVLNSG